MGASDEPRTNKEQRQRSFSRLLSAAQELFVSDGYHSTTLDRVASRAGLTKGSVYFHFGSKEKMLVALLDDVERKVVEPVVSAVSSDDLPPLDRLIHFFNFQSSVGLTYGSDILLLIRMSVEFRTVRGLGGDRVREIRHRLHSCLSSIVVQARADGDIRTDLPTAEMVAILMALHDGIFLEWYRSESGLDGKELIRAVRGVLLDGMKDRHTVSDSEGFVASR